MLALDLFLKQTAVTCMYWFVFALSAAQTPPSKLLADEGKRVLFKRASDGPKKTKGPTAMVSMYHDEAVNWSSETGSEPLTRKPGDVHRLLSETLEYYF